MPNKYPEKKGWKIPKQKFKVSNWSDYNKALRQRGDITVSLSEEAIAGWYETSRIYDGSGTPNLYSDFSIIICHEIRLVYKLPLRQCQGFIDSLFRLMKLPLSCPDFSVLSKRLGRLNIKVPRYKKTDKPDDNIHAIAIDSTGLIVVPPFFAKPFGTPSPPKGVKNWRQACLRRALARPASTYTCAALMCVGSHK
jgi:hypothetical protein